MLEKRALALRFDLRHALHRFDGRLDELAVVPNGDVAPFLEFDRGILQTKKRGVGGSRMSPGR